MSIQSQIYEINWLIAQGEKVYKACKQVGMTTKDYYKLRNEKPSKKLTRQEIKKATKILYMGLTHK